MRKFERDQGFFFLMDQCGRCGGFLLLPARVKEILIYMIQLTSFTVFTGKLA